MLSVSDFLKLIGLNHLNPDHNSKEEVERRFRTYIAKNRKMSEDHMKTLVSLREEWKQKFAPDHATKDFEKDGEEEERFRASQQYGADKISEMLYQDQLDRDERRKREQKDSARAAKGKNKMDEPSGSGGGHASSSTRPEGESESAWSRWRPTGAGVWGSDVQNEDEGRDEHARQNDGCPSWPHIASRQLQKYQKKHEERKVQEYIFLYCCWEQCVDCCVRCIEEYDIDPKTCVSTQQDGLGWAGWGGNPVSQEFAEFWASLTS